MRRIITSTTFLTLFFIFGFSSVSFADIVISNSQIWDEDHIVNEDIEILPCATLRITATVRMGPYRSIKVRKGGTLEVIGGKITSQQVGLQKAWQGIYVEGTKNAPQEGCVNTGYVYVIRGSEISNSRGGIRTYRREQSGANTGGVVICKKSTFINNGRSIEFLNYDYGNTASQISKCRFSINQDFLAFGLNFIGHITAWRNQGLDISGNGFGLSASIANHQVFSGKRGVYFLDSSGQIIDNNFNNLSVGLEVDQEGAPAGYNHIAIRENEFNRHVTGARLISENMTIIDNSFLVGSNAGGAIGLDVLLSPGFTCESNDFVGVDTKDGNYGMQVTNLNLNSSLSTHTQNNKFSNLNRGINCVGANRVLFSNPILSRGFTIACSDFIENKHAIFIESDPLIPSENVGIKHNMTPTNYPEIYCPLNTFQGGLDIDIVNTSGSGNLYPSYDVTGPAIYTPTGLGVGVVPFKNKIDCKEGKVAISNNNTGLETLDNATANKQPQKDVQLFPNPVTTELTVALPTQENGEILSISQLYIMSFTGQKVAPPVRKTGNGYQVDTQALPAGMYQIILLLEDGQRLVKPFIKAGR